MYKRTKTLCCNACQSELEYSPYEYYYSGTNLDVLCAQKGWICDRVSGGSMHICPECIRIVGYVHAFGLGEAALKQFDPQTYDDAELVWYADDEFLSQSELVELTHCKKNGRENIGG